MPSSAAAFRLLGAGKRDSLDGAMAVDLRLKEKVEILKTDAYLLILIESSLFSPHIARVPLGFT